MRPKGLPKTGGREKGTPNKATLLRQAEIAASGEIPLDYMLRVMRDRTVDFSRRDEMARAAAPYVHARLAAIEHSGEVARPTVVRSPPVAKTADEWLEQYAPDRCRDV